MGSTLKPVDIRQKPDENVLYQVSDVFSLVDVELAESINQGIMTSI